MGYEAIIFLLIFVGVVLIVEGLYLLAFGRSLSSEKTLNRRLALLEQGKEAQEVLQTLRKERDQHRKSLSLPIVSILTRKAAQANIAFSPRALFLVMVLVALFSFAMLSLFTSATLSTSVLVAIVMGVGGTYHWLNSKAKKRISMFEEQLPDAVDLIVRSLKVGHPFSSAINVVANEMPDPIGSEFGIVADEATYGMDVTQALSDTAERVDLQDMRFFAVAVGIQARSGGNLAEILDGLAKIIRARFKLFRRVRAITAEAKWSGMFLSLFPVAALFGINVMYPGYYNAVIGTDFFVPAAIFVGFMLGMNVFVMRQLVDIKV